VYYFFVPIDPPERDSLVVDSNFDVVARLVQQQTDTDTHTHTDDDDGAPPVVVD